MMFKLLKRRNQSQDQGNKVSQGIEHMLNLPFGYVMDQLTAPFRQMQDKESSTLFSVHVERHPDGQWEIHAIDRVSAKAEALQVDSATDNPSDLEEIDEIEEDKISEEVALERSRNVLSSEKGAFYIGWKFSTRLHGFLLFVASSIALNTFAETAQYTLDPSKRISAEISQDSMNRIAIANDRITQVFGDSEAYEVQTDDTTGQIFIKPTIENGDKPLSLTLITEKNITQDLSLLPSERNATTVILKNTQAPASQNGEGGVGAFPPSTHAGGFMPWGVPPMMGMPPSMMMGHRGGFGSHPGMGGMGMGMPLSYEDHLVNAMKTLTSSGSLAAITLDSEPVRKSPEGVTSTFKAAYQVGSFKGYILEIRNVSDTPMELKEEQFYQQDDLALSLSKHTLKKDETTQLYIVVR